MTNMNNTQINQQLLATCKQALAAMEAQLEADDPQARTQIEWEAEPLATLRTVIAEAERAGKPEENPLRTPWSLHFDRDGTEDYGIICDAEGNDLVASHITSSRTPPRWKDREFGEGCFWLPENDGDPVPHLVKVMRLMTAAPKLLAAAKRTVTQFQLILEMDAPETLTRNEWEGEPLSSLREAIAEAESDE